VNGASVSVCVPTVEEAATIGAVVAMLAGLRDRGVVDQVVVVDGDSADGSARIAAEAGAEVHRQADLVPGLGPVRGKGDALWRAQSVLRGDVVCFVDGDLDGLAAPQVEALLAPLADPAVAMAKPRFDRPFAGGEEGEGGRVTQLVARPLLALFHPELLRFEQPLSGQVAIRRDLLASLPVSTGYGFDVGLLLDAAAAAGAERIAQPDIGTIHNRHRSVADLAPMAMDIHVAVVQRLVAAGRIPPPPGLGDLDADALPLLRPPFASVGAARGG
jgi:glucosyl-3-phosphoglycerate synthase